MRNLLHAIFNGPVWRTFLVMGLFGALFVGCSYNLVTLFFANCAISARMARWR